MSTAVWLKITRKRVFPLLIGCAYLLKATNVKNITSVISNIITTLTWLSGKQKSAKIILCVDFDHLDMLIVSFTIKRNFLTWCLSSQYLYHYAGIHKAFLAPRKNILKASLSWKIHWSPSLFLSFNQANFLTQNVYNICDRFCFTHLYLEVLPNVNWLPLLSQ